MIIDLNSNSRDRFSFLATVIFGISIENYLAARNGRSLFGYAIDRPKTTYLPIFGNPPSNLTESMNTKYVDSLAGYKVNVGSVFPDVNVNADVLLLSTELRMVSENEFSSILIHELCHLVLDGELFDSINLRINQKDEYHGEKLYKKTDFENECKTRHFIKFCVLLAAAAQRYSEISDDFLDRWAIINSAMRKDLRENV